MWFPPADDDAAIGRHQRTARNPLVPGAAAEELLGAMNHIIEMTTRDPGLTGRDLLERGSPR